ncbi:DUF7487 domain-containing protein [Persephonella sp.]
MKGENLLKLSKMLTPRGLGVKISKNPILKKELYNLTSFLPEDVPQSLRIWCIQNDILSKEKLPKCPVCGKLPAYSTGRFRTYCSKRCAQLDKEKFLRKYGVEHHLKSRNVKEKRKKTVLEKYGVDNIGKITREKAKLTMLERYGVDNYTKTAEYHRKRIETSLKKYGVSHPMKSQYIKEKLNKSLKGKRKEISRKVRETLLSRYGVSSPMHIPSVREKVLSSYKEKVWERLLIKLNKNNIKPLFGIETFKNISVKQRKRYPFLCKVCMTKFFDHLDNGHIPVCPECFKNISNPEQVITSFLKEKGITFESNNRTVIKPFEIDIYMPDKNLGIEVNGIYFHTYEKLKKERGLTDKEAKNYHRLKWVMSQNAGINLIQFWDSEIIRKKDVVFSILGSYLNLNRKIYARFCQIREIDEATAYKFFLDNHISFQISLGKNFGLFYNNELLCAVSVGKARFRLEGHEIYRFANKNGINVIGGLGKLIKYAVSKMDIKVLNSYVDLRIFNGIGLEKIGFKRVKITKPDYFYTKDFVNLIPRENLMSSKTGVEENIYACENGYQKIYGVGHALYRIKF